MPYSVLMFDFDGTLANSERIVEENLKEFIDKYNYPEITAKELKHLKADSFFKKLRMLLFMAKIQNQFKERYSQRIPEIEFYEGAQKMLQDSLDAGYQVVILSSNAKENIQDFLRLKKITAPIEVLSSTGFFGKHNTIQKYLNEHQLPTHSVLYIGDEIRDVKSCNKVKVDIAFAGWGIDADADLSEYTIKVRVPHPDNLLPALP